MGWRAIPPFLLGCLLFLENGESEVFTSLSQLEHVLEAEHEVAQNLKSYVDNERHRLLELEKIAAELERHSFEGRQDPEAFLGNPVNAFKLLKRFTVEWEELINGPAFSSTGSNLEEVHSAAASFPDNDDLKGAAFALLRLQDTYDLSADNLAHGRIPGASRSNNMSASDCFELGRQAYNNEDFYHTLLWMQVALDLLDTEAEPSTSRAQLLDYMSYATYQQGNILHAHNLTEQWLVLEPGHARALQNLHFYNEMIYEEEERRRRERIITPFKEEIKNERKRDEWKTTKQFDTYERLCRGEETQPNPHAHLLTCQYRHHHPIFYLSPAKEEIMFLDPFIAVYHHLMTDYEAKVIKELSKPKLGRSRVFTMDDTAPPFSMNRISQSAWIADDEDPAIARVSARTSALTGLSLETVELFQVVNYGIGGHYEPHFDFARPEEIATFDPEVGNRIITVIFYVAAPEAGGATVFPDLGVKLWPEKGSCAVWYNLMRNGEGDYRTKHAGCPTLTGSKWIANKWYHERGQEFTRPCALDPEL